MSDDAIKEAARLKNALARRVKKLIAQTLEPQGFKKEPKPPRWVREGKTLAHGCIFVLHYNQFFCEANIQFLVYSQLYRKLAGLYVLPIHYKRFLQAQSLS